jgi:hypothetical protein
MSLPTYSTGTVAVAAGGTVVTGSGGMWSGTNAKQGDFISIAGSAAVLITEVTDATHLKIAAWPGAAQTAAAYVIYQNYVGRVVGVAAAEDVGTMLEKLHTDGLPFIVGPDETAPDPSFGDEGQMAFKPDTGQWWIKSGGAWTPFSGYTTSDPTKVAKAGDIMSGALGMGVNPAPSQLSVYGASAVKQLGIPDATRTQIVDGSAAAPVTSVGPSLLVSRFENLASFSSQNGAIYGLSVGAAGNQSQPVAIQAYGYQLGQSDCVALFGRAEQHGTGGHAAIAGFVSALAFTSGSSAISFEYETDNQTGAHRPYFSDLTGHPVMLALDINYTSTGSTFNGTAAVLIRSTAGNGKWDVGIGFNRFGNTSPTVTADIQTDSDATNILLANSGAHVNGINLVGAGSSYSGNAFMSPGFSVSGSGAAFATTAPPTDNSTRLATTAFVGAQPGRLTAATNLFASGVWFPQINSRSALVTVWGGGGAGGGGQSSTAGQGSCGGGGGAAGGAQRRITLPVPATVTISNASPAVVSYTAHGLAANRPVKFSTTGALPTGITAGATYFVIAAGLTGNSFQISATSGGAAINTSSAGSGVHTVTIGEVVTIGAGGVGVAGGQGGNGGTSLFGAWCQGQGGNGGLSSAAGTSVNSGAGSGGNGAGGDINLVGTGGGVALIQTTPAVFVIGGVGGPAPLGGGGGGYMGTGSGAGGAGGLPGGGGGGNYTFANATATPGGAGGAGAITVQEYC